MVTYSHFLMTALAGDQLKRRKFSQHIKAFLIGSFMPDVPLALLTLGSAAYYWYLSTITPDFNMGGAMMRVFNELYFKNPWWIGLTSFFHAPLLIVVYIALGWVGMRRGKRWGRMLFWFGLGCAFHSLVDILTHHDDGPVVFYPLNWYYRFPSPVSYWDRRHYGDIFRVFENTLDAAILLYFAVVWVRQRLQKK